MRTSIISVSCELLQAFTTGSVNHCGQLGVILMAETARGAAGVHPAMPVIPDKDFNVQDYGAIGDNAATNTAAIQSAINAASGHGGGIVEVPKGAYWCGPLKFARKVNLHLDDGATLGLLNRYWF
jgi:polygalacturonase